MKSKINSGNLSVERSYLIETSLCTYDVHCTVDLFIQEGDSSTWDSDWDYYGYTDINEIRINRLTKYTEDQDEGEGVDFDKLPEDEQLLLNDLIYNKVNEDDFSGEFK